jgi:hypothetical protein
MNWRWSSPPKRRAWVAANDSYRDLTRWESCCLGAPPRGPLAFREMASHGIAAHRRASTAALSGRRPPRAPSAPTAGPGERPPGHRGRADGTQRSPGRDLRAPDGELRRRSGLGRARAPGARDSRGTRSGSGNCATASDLPRCGSPRADGLQATGRTYSRRPRRGVPVPLPPWLRGARSRSPGHARSARVPARRAPPRRAASGPQSPPDGAGIAIGGPADGREGVRVRDGRE